MLKGSDCQVIPILVYDIICSALCIFFYNALWTDTVGKGLWLCVILIFLLALLFILLFEPLLRAWLDACMNNLVCLRWQFLFYAQNA